MLDESLNHYKILRQLGKGGMGEVYLAEDTRLGRQVALKVLPPDMAGDPDRRMRFEREAKAVAALNHPNIVTIHSVEEAQGTHFITMELVTGRPLSELVPAEGLDLPSFLDVAIPLADALGAAHERGITHRDLKPDNLMMSEEGRVKVLDFGLAKLAEDPSGPSDERSRASTAEVTQEGKILGTVAYMSPEQAEGKTIDTRSDIFSLGIVLHEMASGKRPFEGDTTASLLAAILRDTPSSVADLNPDIPRQLGRIIQRCLDKAPERRYQTAEDVRVELENLKAEVSATRAGLAAPGISSAVASSPPGDSSGPGPRSPRRAGALRRVARVLVVYVLVSAAVLFAASWLTLELGLPDWVPPGVIVLLLIGLPILITTTLVHSESSAHHWLSWRKAILGGVLAFVFWGLVIGGYLVMREHGIGPAATLISSGVFEAKDPVLIADFENRTDDPLLGEAMKEAFSIDLAQSPMVTVVSQDRVGRVLSRMEAAPDTPLDLGLAREVAVRDGIEAVVAGQVSPAGGGYVLSVRLVAPESGEILAASRETARDDGELISAIDGLSKSLRERIGESLKSTRSNKPLEEVTTPSLAALQKYSRAVRMADRSGSADAMVALLEEAIVLDSTFAMAHRKLAIVRSNLGYRDDRTRAALTNAYEHRDRLTERERYLAQAAYYAGVVRDPDRAMDAYERLLELNPDDTWALNNLALQYQQRGDFARAEELFRKATAIEMSALQMGNLAAALIWQGKFDAADSALNRFAVEIPDAPFEAWVRSAVAINRGDYDTFEEMVRRDEAETRGDHLTHMRALETVACAAAIRGKLAEADRRYAEVMQLYDRERVSEEYLEAATSRAAIRIWHAGDRQNALAMLDAALEKYPLTDLPPAERDYTTYCVLYADGGDLDRARAFLAEQEALADSLGDEEEDLLASRGLIALAEGREDQALDDLRRYASGARPRDLGAMAWLARVYDATGEVDSAIVYYERYLETPHLFRAYWDQFFVPIAFSRLGELHEARGDHQSAARYHQLLLDVWEHADPELQARLRVVQRRLGRMAPEARSVPQHN